LNYLFDRDAFLAKAVVSCSTYLDHFTPFQAMALLGDYINKEYTSIKIGAIIYGFRNCIFGSKN